MGFLIPFLLSLGLLIIFRRIFNKNSVIIFLLLMSSFSPGVVFNLTDYWSMEQTVYAVYFAAALLWFMEEPTEKIFLWLALSLMACSLALSHISLYFNILFIPLFFIAANLFGPLPFTQSVKRLWAAVPWWKWALLWLACAALMTPAYITYLQGSDFTRASIGSRVYEYADLKVGNPLEFLAISTPGIGCAWDGKEKDFILIPATGFLMSYGYMGILSLPLAIFGLVYGKPAWRKRLFILFTIFCTVITLSAYSPIFSLLLAPPTILRSVNHYSDALFRGGGFIILLLAAGLGAEAILGRERSFKKNFWPSTWALRSCQ